MLALAWLPSQSFLICFVFTEILKHRIAPFFLHFDKWTPCQRLNQPLSCLLNRANRRDNAQLSESFWWKCVSAFFFNKNVSTFLLNMTTSSHLRRCVRDTRPLRLISSTFGSRLQLQRCDFASHRFKSCIMRLSAVQRYLWEFGCRNPSNRTLAC